MDLNVNNSDWLSRAMQISFKLKRNLGGIISTSCVNKIIQWFKYIQTVIIPSFVKI